MFKSHVNLSHLVGLLFMTAGALAQVSPDVPSKQITNGLVTAKLYLPDPSKGFYRGTRFDWSGIVATLEYQGHSYYGPWFTRTDPTVRDFVYDGLDIIAGPCSTIIGPVEEFSTKGLPIGFKEARAGDTFLKIGVGVLRKPDDSKYSAFRLYDIVDHGKWSAHASSDSVTFEQELRDPASGYAYIYRKTVRLPKNKPEMVLEHNLRNIGSKPIESSVYDHNFLVLDKQAPGPDFEITLPFGIKADGLGNQDLVQINGNRIVFQKLLTGKDRVYFTIQGFTNAPDDYKIQIENKRLKTGVRIEGNRPITHEALWSIRSVLSMEPFIDMAIAPGEQFSWEYKYQYYVLP